MKLQGVEWPRMRGQRAGGQRWYWGGALLLLTSLSCSALELADKIYSGGAILTMEDGQPRAEALATRQGRILAVGSRAEVMRYSGAKTEMVNLAGRALLPGFVDSHGHVVGGGMQAMSANLLAPPDGPVKDIASLQQALLSWQAQNGAAVKKFGAIIGFGYDPAQMAEQRHPTAAELDAVSKDLPIYLMHQSGHFGVANTAALKLIGITAKTPDPAGGIIRRLADGRPNGVMEETAHFQSLMKVMGGLGVEGFTELARAGAQMWARYGYTTAQEGRAMPDTVATMRKVASEGGFAIDLVAYVDVLVDRNFIAAHVSQDYVNRVRVGGAKLTIDGSPQGFTAWRDRPYYKPVGDYPPGYAGYPAATEAQVNEAMAWAYKNGIQVLTHANGERATDVMLAAMRAAAAKYGPGRRPVLIHGQFMREDQVDALKAQGVFPSLFPMHTFYWGDWHREHTVGPVLAEDMSPTGWVLQRGMKFGTHHDAPVAFPDSMRVLSATVTRRSRTGDILGPRHRVPVETALKAMTIWPAWQHFEENSKGSLAPGKLADLVVLSADPTAVDPEKLDQLKVLQTIKEDRVVYAAPAESATTSFAPLAGESGEAFSRALGVLAGYSEMAGLPDTEVRQRVRLLRASSGAHGGACVSQFLVQALHAQTSAVPMKP
ncbi:amidohydrolase [Roseateles sp.]|uniref:amidohydrolase n=1 Tax=Roseateles sp. TaxID=1971397 RepID=UPI003BA82AD9